ncbi:hypothetical protein SOVF_204670 isoform A [Spinacia oleracea]|nr:hypothetical protein SOVF_204670 isoform A [Spinacia oleracea]
MEVPQPLQTLAKTGAILAGGIICISFAASTTIKVIQSATEAKRKRTAKPCQGCKGKGFHICKLCKGNATIQWSPLYDPIHINPCQCPTCDGHRERLLLSSNGQCATTRSANQSISS